MRDIETREDIELLLESFYEIAIKDELIGHHFADLDLKTHIPTFVDFWDKALFGRPVYFGNPLAIHVKIDDKNPIKLEHFQRWVSLFGSRVDARFAGETAENAKLRAKMIANSLYKRINEPDGNRVGTRIERAE